MFDNFLTACGFIKSNAFFIAFFIPQYFFLDSILNSFSSVDLPSVDADVLRIEEKNVLKRRVKAMFIDNFSILWSKPHPNFLENCNKFYNDKVFFYCIKTWFEINEDTNYNGILDKMTQSYQDKWKGFFMQIENCRNIEEFQLLKIDPLYLKLIILDIQKW